ncbi:hypothetical protein ACOMHN_063485 [Nucella lapillus]
MWSVYGAQAASCPWDEAGLLKWSDASTWSNNEVPVDGSQVTIPANKRVLLDVQPASLATLTIEGVLVWGNVDGLTLNSHYILVRGEFHIGSRFCRFSLTARIRLHGNSQDQHVVTDHEFGRKFLGVAPNGTLEIHGKRKTSWTKLAQTVHPRKNVQCALVYDHTNLTHNKAGVVSQLGVNVMVWNEDGSFLDFAVFKNYQDFGPFFTSIPNKTVVGMYVHGPNGIKVKEQSLVDPIVALGGSLISDINDNYGFSFIARKDPKSTASAREVLRVDNSVDGDSTGFLSLLDDANGLLFQVAVNPKTVKAHQMFQVLNTDAAYPKLTLVDEVKSWREGDEVLLASTDYEWEQAEIRKIVRCKQDDCNSRQIRVNESFTYMHYGNITQNVDERGEVAMLSRSVVIEGVMESTCIERTDDEKNLKLCEKFQRDTFGGHLMVVRGFKAVRIKGVKLLHMGQQKHRGAYPLHFHMVDNAKGAYLRENTIMDSFSRCCAVHGTDWLEISDNVCYRHLGHGIFLEDSVEQNNTIHGNLVLGTRHGTQLLSDRLKSWCSDEDQLYCDGLASFWLTHPNNEVNNNVAAGGDGIGFMIVFADRPLGPSLARQMELGREHNPKVFPLRFTRNVAHSNKDTGVHMDEKVSTGTGMENKGDVQENGLIRTENEYDPHVNGLPAWTDMSYGTYFKNKIKNLWIKGGNVVISFSAIADSKEGFAGGTTLFDSGTKLYKCIFVGETDNTGEVSDRKIGDVLLPMERSYTGEPNFTLTAASLYQGPNIVDSCFFDKYTTIQWCLEPSQTVSQCSPSKIVTRYSGAISFKRSNTYPTMTSSYAVNNSFGFCDNTDDRHWVFQGADSTADWAWKDGNRAVFLRDRDGHLTGTVNASIVPNYELYSGDECLLRPDWGDLQVCPYRYIKLELLGNDGSLSSSMKSKYPLIITRDDAPYKVPFDEHMGNIRNEFLLRTNRSFILDFNKSLDNAAYPAEIKIFGYGVEKGDVVRVGLCQPLDVQSFNITMFYPVYLKNNATWVHSLADLDADNTGQAFFHDKTNGILFFKVLSFHSDTNDTQRCPDGHCWRTHIKPVGGSLTNVRTCNTLDIEPFVGKLRVNNTPRVRNCPAVGSPQGLGAIDWSNVGYIERNAYSVQCRAFTTPVGRSAPVSKGCFKEKGASGVQELKTKEAVVMYDAMTVDFCVHRCYYRNYHLAALARGYRCTCSHSLLESSDYASPAVDCDAPCRGNESQSCGGGSEMDVWTTGLQ